MATTEIIPVLTTIAYRSSIARAVAGIEPISTAVTVAFGDGGRPVDYDHDEGLESEFLRVPAVCVPNGPRLMVSGVATGALTQGRTIREAGVFTNTGVLITRYLTDVVTLGPAGEWEIQLVFEY